MPRQSKTGAASTGSFGLTLGGGYFINKSLRFRSSNSAYLARTPTVAGNRQKFTFSAWIKRGYLGTSSGFLINAGVIVNGGVCNQDGFTLTNDSLQINLGYTGTGYSGQVTTNQVFRDPSAWYHIVVAIDTTQATASNRCLIYVNGVSAPYTVNTTITQNFSTQFNNTSVHNIGRIVPDGFGGAAWQYFDGYMAEVNFVDGQALTPSSFGSTNLITGVWQPIAYTGVYGTNGFYLPFTNITTTTTLGNDFSGNGNNYTPSGFSLTAGTTYDSMTDVPTLTSPTVANYAVLNPLLPPFTDTSGQSITNGNLTAAGNNGFGISTIGVSKGKFYCEFNPPTNSPSWCEPGIFAAPFNPTSYIYAGPNYRWFSNDGNVYDQPGAAIKAYSTFGGADVIGMALDMDNGKVYFAKNNVWQGTADPVAGTNPVVSGLTGTWFFANWQTNGYTFNFNFGQRPFTYTPPTGYVALNTYNLSTPSITKSNQYFDATTYTGNGTTQSITNSGIFQPDLVWIKARSQAYDNVLEDSVRGVTKSIQSNSTNAETVYAGSVTSFNTNGFSLGNATAWNENTTTYVGYQWQANKGSTVSNTSGTITSTVSVNQTAGFSIVTYTGTGVNATVGHGLGAVPAMIIIKSRSNAATNWTVYHVGIGNTKALLLNGNYVPFVNSTYWQNTTPTSTVFSLGTDGSINVSGQTYVAYVWTEVSGFSAFGTYTSNLNVDGPFIYTGFQPKYTLYKNTSVARDWMTNNGASSPFNLASLGLFPNLFQQEINSPQYYSVDYVSNGFKLRNNGQESNDTAGNFYIYAAFAANPFKYSLAR